MGSRARTLHVALVVAGTYGITGASAVLAQRPHPQVGRAASPPPSPAPSPLTTPYPGATVMVDPRWYGVQPFQHNRRGRRSAMPDGAYYYPSPYAYAPYYPQYGGVTDVNGVPLAAYFAPEPSSTAPVGPASVPDLRGSPYVVTDGGAMAVDFGNNDRRTVPACAAMAAAETPDGQPRTVFYTPPADGVILRPGSRGRVLGTPGAGAKVCYEVDQYGRMVLDY
jgi:hypothetical protein